MEITKLLRIIGFIAYPLILIGSLYKFFNKSKLNSTSKLNFIEIEKNSEFKNNKYFFMITSFIATLIGIIYYFLTNEDE